MTYILFSCHCCFIPTQTLTHLSNSSNTLSNRDGKKSSFVANFSVNFIWFSFYYLFSVNSIQPSGSDVQPWHSPTSSRLGIRARPWRQTMAPISDDPRSIVGMKEPTAGACKAAVPLTCRHIIRTAPHYCSNSWMSPFSPFLPPPTICWTTRSHLQRRTTSSRSLQSSATTISSTRSIICSIPLDQQQTSAISRIWAATRSDTAWRSCWSKRWGEQVSGNTGRIMWNVVY